MKEQEIAALILLASGEMNKARTAMDTALACLMGGEVAGTTVAAAAAGLQKALNHMNDAAKAASE